MARALRAAVDEGPIDRHAPVQRRNIILSESLPR
jgi:hypothetical protein